MPSNRKIIFWCGWIVAWAGVTAGTSIGRTAGSYIGTTEMLALVLCMSLGLPMLVMEIFKGPKLEARG